MIRVLPPYPGALHQASAWVAQAECVKVSCSVIVLGKGESWPSLDEAFHCCAAAVREAVRGTRVQRACRRSVEGRRTP